MGNHRGRPLLQPESRPHSSQPPLQVLEGTVLSGFQTSGRGARQACCHQVTRAPWTVHSPRPPVSPGILSPLLHKVKAPEEASSGWVSRQQDLRSALAAPLTCPEGHCDPFKPQRARTDRHLRTGETLGPGTEVVVGGLQAKGTVSIPALRFKGVFSQLSVKSPFRTISQLEAHGHRGYHKSRGQRFQTWLQLLAGKSSYCVMKVRGAKLPDAVQRSVPKDGFLSVK